jgi:Ca-activated chloride channel family protein
LIPIFYLLHYIYNKYKKKKLANFAESKTQQVIIPHLSIGKQYLKFTLWNLSFFFLVLALANPQKGTSIEKKERTGTTNSTIIKKRTGLPSVFVIFC